MNWERSYQAGPGANLGQTASAPVFRLGFGERIMRFRENRGWCRAALAAKLGVPQGRLGRWERGAHDPPLDMLAPLAKALGVTLDELITGVRPTASSLSAAEREKLALHLGALRQFMR